MTGEKKLYLVRTSGEGDGAIVSVRADIEPRPASPPFVDEIGQLIYRGGRWDIAFCRRSLVRHLGPGLAEAIREANRLYPGGCRD